MTVATTTTTTSHSEQQAQAQFESIIKMVDALDRESAASTYASNLSRERCVELLAEIGVDSSDNELVETLREAVAVNLADETLDDPDFEFDEDEARQAINEDPLSIEVRSNWYTLDADEAQRKPSEFCILLCTGGPAVRIVGDLDENSQPSRPRLQHQDWGTPWMEYSPANGSGALQTYCEQFYFGE